MEAGNLGIVTLYAAILILMQVAMSIQVVRGRAKSEVSFGWGDDMDLARVVRAHGNFLEYVPITLIVMALAALGGMGALSLHALGGVLVAARAVHALGLYVDWLPGRVIGQTVTWIVMAAAGILALVTM